jgi:DNA adenine methylase
MKSLHDCCQPQSAVIDSEQWIIRRIHNYIPYHECYVDLFAGNSSVLLAKPRVPLEVMNDLDSEVVNFYGVLRDPDKYLRLQRLVSLTPVRGEAVPQIIGSKVDDDVRKAWIWFVRARLAQIGINGFNHSGKNTRRAAPLCVDRLLSRIKFLPEIHKRLQGVQIENQDFLKIVERYDSETTLFYVNPYHIPFCSNHEDTVHEDFLKLMEVMPSVKGKCLLTGPANRFFQELELAGWKKEQIVPVHSPKSVRLAKPVRICCLWLSPNLQKALGRPQSLRKAA